MLCRYLSQNTSWDVWTKKQAVNLPSPLGIWVVARGTFPTCEAAVWDHLCYLGDPILFQRCPSGPKWRGERGTWSCELLSKPVWGLLTRWCWYSGRRRRRLLIRSFNVICWKTHIKFCDFHSGWHFSTNFLAYGQKRRVQNPQRASCCVTEAGSIIMLKRAERCCVCECFPFNRHNMCTHRSPLIDLIKQM